MSEKLEKLKGRLGEVADINHAASVLGWDQQVNMPPGGNEARGLQLATLSKIAQEKFIADEVGRLIQDLKLEFDGADPDSDEASLIRVTARDYDKARRIPPAFIREKADCLGEGFRSLGRGKEQI